MEVLDTGFSASGGKTPLHISIGPACLRVEEYVGDIQTALCRAQQLRNSGVSCRCSDFIRYD